MGSRVAAVDLYNAGASGSVDGFGQLTALSELRLGKNKFSGVPLSVSHTVDPTEQLGHRSCCWVEASHSVCSPYIPHLGAYPGA